MQIEEALLVVNLAFEKKCDSFRHFILKIVSFPLLNSNRYRRFGLFVYTICAASLNDDSDTRPNEQV